MLQHCSISSLPLYNIYHLLSLLPPLKILDQYSKCSIHILNAQCQRSSPRGPSLDQTKLATVCVQAVQGAIPGLYTHNIFQSFMPILREGFPKICPNCFKAIEARNATERRAMFDRLPQLLGVSVDVEGWKDQALIAADAAP